MTTEQDAYANAILTVLGNLVDQLAGLSEEQLNWKPAAEGTNSLWVLAIHSMANAEQAVLAVIGGAPDTRDREAEFAAHGVSSEAARIRWAALREQLRGAVLTLAPVDLDREYTHPRRGVMTGREVLLLVIQHASEHLGHAGLTRDLLRAHPVAS